MKKKSLHIGVLIETSRAYGRGVATGVIQYAREHDWILYPQESGLFLQLPPWLGRMKLDGIIADIYTHDMAQTLKALKVPVVDTYCEGHFPGAPMVETDPEAVGQMAASFFLQAGFTRFAFCGYPGIYFSDGREKAFAHLLKSRGASCDCYSPSAKVRKCHDLFLRERGGMEYEKDLTHWLRQLPKPIAIFACNDIRGQQLLNACRDCGVQAPEEVTVLGVDNDHLICEMSHPTLSSISPDTEAIGRHAAEALDQLMLRQPRPQVRQSLPPSRIVERQSTDIVPDPHPLISKATHLIRDGACTGLTVELLCDQMNLGRTHLDTLFRTRLGRTVAKEIGRVRLNRARRLLLDTDLPLSQVARQSGFLTLPHFCRVFKRETSFSPTQFRQNEGSGFRVQKSG
jgi:LacI family transcriptional regulator